MKFKLPCSSTELPDPFQGGQHGGATANFNDLAHEHAVLARMLGSVQERITIMAMEHECKVAQLQREIVRLRARIIIRDTVLAMVRPDHESTEVPSENLHDYLDAADWVICQTGCVSHGEYWRAQGHCTRTGKVCVLVQVEAELLNLNRKQADKTLNTPAARA